MNGFLDQVKEWTDVDVAALALGRSIGVFSPDTNLADAKGVLLTNSAAGNTLYGMLERLAWLGVLERDEQARRYRSAGRQLHPLDARDDVPSLAEGPPQRAYISLSLDSPEGFRLDADRAGFRHLARVFDEIADSALESGWRFDRDGEFKPGGGSGPGFSFRLADGEPEESAPKP